jgi:transcriptional regulator with XRE-family HTH domain
VNIEAANRLVRLRKQFNYTREELAERLGISSQAVLSWEKAEATPDADALIELSKLYGVSIDSLLAAEGENGPAYQPRAAITPRTGLTNYAAPRSVSAPYIHEHDTESVMRLLRRLSPAFPIIVTMIYLLLGFLFGFWHPSWMIFMTIPIFYVMIRK